MTVSQNKIAIILAWCIFCLSKPRKRSKLKSTAKDRKIFEHLVKILTMSKTHIFRLILVFLTTHTTIYFILYKLEKKLLTGSERTYF